MDNLSGNSYIQATPVNTQGKARVDLVKSDFDAIIWQKGYDVLLDRAIKCPCRNVADNQGLSDCKNCGGSGWCFINRKATRMVLQSMNKDTQFKEWSMERLGTTRISCLNEERISYMDRITVTSATVTTSQTVHFKEHSDGVFRAAIIYPIKKLIYSFLFKGSQTPLFRAVEGTDFDIVDGNWIELKSQHNQDHPTMSLRYEHNPMYHILDTNRDVMTSKKSISGKNVKNNYPVSGIAKLAHYVLDEQSFNGDFLLDNSFEENCKDKYTDKQC
jgi:hypothetical protein